jgi:hypothetical protein
MKYLLLITALLFSFSCMAQRDPCRKISRKLDRKKAMVTYKSPETKHAYVIKQITTDTFFAILFHFYDEKEHFDTYGAAVEFEDGTSISDDAVSVKCVQEKAVLSGSANMASSSTNGGRYILQAFFRVSAEYAPLFASKRIAKVRLHNAMQAIPKNDGYNLKKYIGCMISKT